MVFNLNFPLRILRKLPRYLTPGGSGSTKNSFTVFPETRLEHSTSLDDPTKTDGTRRITANSRHNLQ